MTGIGCAFIRSHRSPGRTEGSVRLKEPTSDQIRKAWRGPISAEPPIMASRSAILERAGFLRVLGRNRSFEAVLVELVESPERDFHAMASLKDDIHVLVEWPGNSRETLRIAPGSALAVCKERRAQAEIVYCVAAKCSRGRAFRTCSNAVSMRSIMVETGLSA